VERGRPDTRPVVVRWQTGPAGLSTALTVFRADTVRAVFHVDRQTAVRELLLERARSDGRVTGAAITGSAAHGAADRWSDVDLLLGVDDPGGVGAVLTDWTAFACDHLGAVHHFDPTGGGATYRAFLLDDGLEVDLGFVPAAGFGPLGDGAFSVVFGSPTARGGDHRPDPDHLVGLAWHHVLHARTSIDRGLPWRAEHWISAVRDLVLTLGCVRAGVPSAYAKGADQLPAADLSRLEASLVSSLDPGELARALRAAVAALLVEVTRTDPAAAARITPLLTALATPVAGSDGRVQARTGPTLPPNRM